MTPLAAALPSRFCAMRDLLVGVFGAGVDAVLGDLDPRLQLGADAPCCARAGVSFCRLRFF